LEFVADSRVVKTVARGFSGSRVLSITVSVGASGLVLPCSCSYSVLAGCDRPEGLVVTVHRAVAAFGTGVDLGVLGGFFSPAAALRRLGKRDSHRGLRGPSAAFGRSRRVGTTKHTKSTKKRKRGMGGVGEKEEAARHGAPHRFFSEQDRNPI